MKIEKPENPLITSGPLSIFFVGVGSAFAMEHYQTSILIAKGDTHILVDCGENGPLALNSHGIDVSDIQTLFVTHLHSDHVAGVGHLALKNYYVARPFMKKPKLRCIVNEHMQQLMWDKALSAGLMYNEIIGEELARPLCFEDYFTVVRPTWKQIQPREVWEVKIGEIKLEIFRTLHIPQQAPTWDAAFPSYGLMIDDRVFYSGDSQFDPSLIDQYKHAEAFFHDVQFFPGAVHAPLADLKKLPEDIKKKMFLMHYADNFEEQEIGGFAGWATQGNSYVFE